jgi:hypothetical protein
VTHTEKPRVLAPWVLPLLATLLGAAGALVCARAAGAPSLDLLLGSAIIAAILTPPLCIAWRWSFLAVAAGTSVVWLIHPIAWLACTLTLLAFLTAAAAAMCLLVRIRIHPLAASAIVTMLALAWLIWPVWASHWLPGRDVKWLIDLHPLFAINGAAKDLGIWTEQHVAYRLTALGQDVPYQLPTSVAPCVLFHGLLALGLFCCTRIALRSTNQIDADATASMPR